MALGQFDDVETSVIRSLSSASLYMFTRRMFYQRRGYVWQRANHHAPICNALERVFNGETKRLIINIPPRYSKTEIAVVNFIAWAMGRVPDCEFIHASYSAALAVNNSVQIRNLVQHEEYRAIFPDLALAGESGHHWKTTAGGVMYATGAGGTITGFGAGRHREGFGGCIIIDDPHKADEARSEVRRQNVIDWFQNTVESRKNSPDTPIILIMQRLHEKDLAGWLLDGGNGEEWEHLCLPAIQEDGTALWPEKHDIETLRRMEQARRMCLPGSICNAPPRLTAVRSSLTTCNLSRRCLPGISDGYARGTWLQPQTAATTRQAAGLALRKTGGISSPTSCAAGTARTSGTGYYATRRKKTA